MVTTKNQKLTAEVGAEVGVELGSQMIASYRHANPTDTVGYFIGRNILEQVLAQPGCVGIKFYNAYNEAGVKTLVYVGIDNAGNDMLSVASINLDGRLETNHGIVADRIRVIKEPPPPEESWWEF